jgi:antirestriction protein ArdC
MARTQNTAKLDATLQAVVDSIIAKLEKGEIPWVKPWRGRSVIPHNGTTGREYGGLLNPLILWFAEEGKGFNDNRWAGFGQWAKAKNPVRKGERGTVIAAPIMTRFPVEKEDGSKVWVERVKGWKDVTVFNNQQTVSPLPLAETKAVDPTEGFGAAADLLRRSKADIRHGGNRASYAILTDTINIPNAGDFNTVSDYWATMLHEMTHWTGHNDRCNREGIVKFTGFGTPTYAYEELIAEMGSAFLCHRLGVVRDGLIDNHAAYIQSWIKRLKDDPQVLMDATTEANKALRFLMSAE